MTTPDTLSEARRQLLERFRRGEFSASKGALEPLVPQPRGTQLPLSPDLEQLWLHDQVSGGAPINNESFTIHKRGPLQPVVLERCFTEIVRRHEIWRSAFPFLGGKTVQRIDPNVRITLPLIDLRHLPLEERDPECLRIATEEARRPFDLDSAPLFRVCLVRWADDYHRVYLTLHRLVFDCASIEHVLIGELAALYSAYSADLPSPLPEPVFQHSDYAAWKRRQTAGGTQAAQMEYWRGIFAGDLPTFEPPADRPRPAVPTWRSEMETCAISAQQVEALRELSQQEGVTPYMILLAAFHVLLYRYSGQNEILIGGKANARTRREFEPLIGSMVNTIAFRSSIVAGLSFRDFLARVKSTVLGALAHSEISFDEIVRELAPQAQSTRHPIFQILFSMRSLFGAFPDGWDLSDMEVHSGSSIFDLFVEFAEQSQGLAGRFVYNTDIFDRTAIQDLQRSFLQLLQKLVSDPGQPVSQELLSDPVPKVSPVAPREIVPPQDEIEHRLLNVWKELLAMDTFGVTDNYFDLGGHSVLALRLFSDIKFCFDLDLPLATLFHAPTVRTMAGVIRDCGLRAAAPVVPIQPNGTKPPVICIGAVNGELILYRRLAMELGEDQPLYGLQPFRLLDRLSTVPALATSYIEQLEQSGLSRPHCLLGYSFGGLVAVEMARQLSEKGMEPPFVALIDSPYLAGCKALEPWMDRIRRYRYHVNRIARESGGLRHLADRLRSHFFRQIHKVSTTVGVDVPNIAGDVKGRQLLAGENYRAKPYGGRVWLFKAESRSEFFGNDPALGWGKVLSDLRIEGVPGDHGSINTGANLKILVGKLITALEESSS